MGLILSCSQTFRLSFCWTLRKDFKWILCGREGFLAVLFPLPAPAQPLGTALGHSRLPASSLVQRWAWGQGLQWEVPCFIWTGLWASWSSARCPCLWQKGWHLVISKVPSNPNHVMVLWFCDLLLKLQTQVEVFSLLHLVEDLQASILFSSLCRNLQIYPDEADK